MKIRNKIAIGIITITMILIIAMFFTARYIILKSYLELEENSAKSDMVRTEQSIGQVSQSVADVLASWAIWDDTYKFIVDRNEAYIKSNLKVSSFTSSNIDMVLYYNTEGNSIYRIVANKERTDEGLFPEGIEDYLSQTGNLVSQTDIQKSTQGVILTKDGMIFVAAHPIVTSENKGPILGTIIMGRYFTPRDLMKIQEMTRVKVDIKFLSDIKSDKLRDVYKKLTSRQYFIQLINKDKLIIHSLLKDINEKPIAIISSELPRNIYKIGLGTVYYYNFVLTVAIFLLAITLWLFLNINVIRRIEGLRSSMIKKGLSKSANRNGTESSDEMGSVESLYHHATHDPLTGLANRNILSEAFNYLSNKAENKNKYLAIAFIDLDNFKYINDSLGHDFGDEFLIHASNKIMEFIDKDNYAVRLGGDEFIVIITSESIENIKSSIDKLYNAMNVNTKINSHEIKLSCSIGVSIFPQNGKDIDTLISNADMALYQAKESGRSRYVYYSSDLRVARQDASKKVVELQNAIDKNELYLNYQPIYSTHTGEIISVEALVRWKHPENLDISASEIISTAERSGLIVQISEFVLRAACFQMKAWHDLGLVRVPISINLSLAKIRYTSFNTIIKNILHETKLDPKYLELEITETGYSNLDTKLLSEFQDLVDLGVSLVVDDFGIGYSGIGYLKSLPITKIKIDKSFIHDILYDNSDRTIVFAILEIAHQFNLRVIAEGVESKEQFDFLRLNNVDAAQGFYLCKPLSKEEFESKYIKHSSKV